MSNYTNNSISSLENEQQVRQRPAVFFGTNDEFGARHAVFEIIANAIDEHRAGYGSQITIISRENGEIEISDNGRGVPMAWNETEKKMNWELVFCQLYASGKYDDSSYSASLGLNGVGATATQYASEYMIVRSFRDGKAYQMQFKKGVPYGELETKVLPEQYKRKTGTTIIFKLDKEVFINLNDNVFDLNFYGDVLRRQAMLHKGLKINLIYEAKDLNLEFYYPNGAIDYINNLKEYSKVALISKEPVNYYDTKIGTDRPEDPDYTLNMECSFAFTKDTSICEIYHNSSLMSEGGVTVDAYQKAVSDAVTDFALNKNKLKKGEKFTYKDVEPNIVFIGDTSAPGNRTYFKNQTKAAINNPFIKKQFQDFINYSVGKWLNDNGDTSLKVVDAVIANKKAREEADKVSKRVKTKLTKGMTFGNKPDKFVDCSCKEVEKRELFIVEGDSALGSCKTARDPKYQAIMPVRGKTLNCLKKSMGSILSNDIIIDLVRVLGCGIEARKRDNLKGLPEFDIDKLNWGKIIICTDADLDGMHIRCLILTMLKSLCPKLLTSGKVFIAETPLFEINVGKDTYFAYTQQEKLDILGKLENEGVKESKIRIQRSKGLGENDPDMMNKSTMNPESRRLVDISVGEDEEQINFFFEALLGNDIESRKYLIDEYFKSDAEIDTDY